MVPLYPFTIEIIRENSKGPTYSFTSATVPVGVRALFEAFDFKSYPCTFSWRRRPSSVEWIDLCGLSGRTAGL